MIAAGHPDLVFDLEAFSAAMPRHWRSAERSVAERSVLERRSDRSASRGPRACRSGDGPAIAWPEYAELDCFSCHH